MWQYNYINIPKNDEIYHYGILGMHWGTRRSNVQLLQRLANDRNKSKQKLDATIRKSEKTKSKVNKLTNKLAKNGGYITEIGYAMAKSNGRKLSRELHKDKKLDRQIEKIKAKMEKNGVTMQTSMKDLPKDQIALGKQVITDALKIKA